MLQSLLTEKVFAKGGLNWTKSSISTNRSECFFHETKLLKKCEVEKQARLNATDSSIKYSTPPFANTMLSAVFFIPNCIHKLYLSNPRKVGNAVKNSYLEIVV